MLTWVKNRIKTRKVSYRTVLIAGFSVMVLLGFAIPYFGFGAGTTASAAGSLTATASASQPVSGSATYVYTQLSLRDAYPYYIAAAFMVAGGLSLYALSYIPSRATRRSRYASRFESWARTTY